MDAHRALVRPCPPPPANGNSDDDERRRRRPLALPGIPALPAWPTAAAAAPVAAADPAPIMMPLPTPTAGVATFAPFPASHPPAPPPSLPVAGSGGGGGGFGPSATSDHCAVRRAPSPNLAELSRARFSFVHEGSSWDFDSGYHGYGCGDDHGGDRVVVRQGGGGDVVDVCDDVASVASDDASGISVVTSAECDDLDEDGRALHGGGAVAVAVAAAAHRPPAVPAGEEKAGSVSVAAAPPPPPPPPAAAIPALPPWDLAAPAQAKPSASASASDRQDVAVVATAASFRWAEAGAIEASVETAAAVGGTAALPPPPAADRRRPLSVPAAPVAVVPPRPFDANGGAGSGAADAAGDGGDGAEAISAQIFEEGAAVVDGWRSGGGGGSGDDDDRDKSASALPEIAAVETIEDDEDEDEREDEDESGDDESGDDEEETRGDGLVPEEIFDDGCGAKQEGALLPPRQRTQQQSSPHSPQQTEQHEQQQQQHKSPQAAEMCLQHRPHDVEEGEEKEKEEPPAAAGITALSSTMKNEVPPPPPLLRQRPQRQLSLQPPEQDEQRQQQQQQQLESPQVAELRLQHHPHDVEMEEDQPPTAALSSGAMSVEAAAAAAAAVADLTERPRKELEVRGEESEERRAPPVAEALSPSIERASEDERPRGEGTAQDGDAGGVSNARPEEVDKGSEDDGDNGGGASDEERMEGGVGSGDPAAAAEALARPSPDGVQELGGTEREDEDAPASMAVESVGGVEDGSKDENDDSASQGSSSNESEAKMCEEEEEEEEEEITSNQDVNCSRGDGSSVEEENSVSSSSSEDEHVETDDDTDEEPSDMESEDEEDEEDESTESEPDSDNETKSIEGDDRKGDFPFSTKSPTARADAIASSSSTETIPNAISVTPSPTHHWNDGKSVVVAAASSSGVGPGRGRKRVCGSNWPPPPPLAAAAAAPPSTVRVTVKVDGSEVLPEVLRDGASLDENNPKTRPLLAELEGAEPLSSVDLPWTPSDDGTSSDEDEGDDSEISSANAHQVKLEKEQSEKARILSELPPYILDSFNSVGWASWPRRRMPPSLVMPSDGVVYCPVLVISPFDVPANSEARWQWMKMHSEMKASQQQPTTNPIPSSGAIDAARLVRKRGQRKQEWRHLVYFYSEGDNPGGAFSVLGIRNRFVPYEEGVRLGYNRPPKLLKKIRAGSKLSRLEVCHWEGIRMMVEDYSQDKVDRGGSMFFNRMKSSGQLPPSSVAPPPQVAEAIQKPSQASDKKTKTSKTRKLTSRDAKVPRHVRCSRVPASAPDALLLSGLSQDAVLPRNEEMVAARARRRAKLSGEISPHLAPKALLEVKKMIQKPPGQLPDVPGSVGEKRKPQPTVDASSQSGRDDATGVARARRRAKLSSGVLPHKPLLEVKKMIQKPPSQLLTPTSASRKRKIASEVDQISQSATSVGLPCAAKGRQRLSRLSQDAGNPKSTSDFVGGKRRGKFPRVHASHGHAESTGPLLSEDRFPEDKSAKDATRQCTTETVVHHASETVSPRLPEAATAQPTLSPSHGSGHELLRIGVGTRLEVYWSEYDTFYPCTVSRWSFPPGRAFLVYDDGDEEEVEDLGAECFRILEEENGSVGRSLSASLSSGPTAATISTCYL